MVEVDTLSKGRAIIDILGEEGICRWGGDGTGVCGGIMLVVLLIWRTLPEVV